MGIKKVSRRRWCLNLAFQDEKGISHKQKKGEWEACKERIREKVNAIPSNTEILSLLVRGLGLTLSKWAKWEGQPHGFSLPNCRVLLICMGQQSRAGRAWLEAGGLPELLQLLALWLGPVTRLLSFHFLFCKFRIRKHTHLLFSVIVRTK